MSRRRTRLHLVLALAGVLAAGCSDRTAAGPPVVAVVNDQDQDGFDGTLLVNPSVPRPALVLPDTDGTTFDLRADRDGVTALFFGYTSCREVCPSTMAALARARRSLPEEVQDDFRLVFVTDDPANDSPQVLRSYLDQFDEDIVGLLGGEARSARAAKQLQLPASELHAHPPATDLDGHEALEHSGVVYLFGPGDRQAVLHSGGSRPSQYAADVQRLLSQR